MRRPHMICKKGLSQCMTIGCDCYKNASAAERLVKAIFLPDAELDKPKEKPVEEMTQEEVRASLESHGINVDELGRQTTALMRVLKDNLRLKAEKDALESRLAELEKALNDSIRMMATLGFDADRDWEVEDGKEMFDYLKETLSNPEKFIAQGQLAMKAKEEA